MTLSLETLRREGDEFHQAISRELYQSGSGLKKTAELQAIYARFANVLSDEALDMVRELFRDSPADSEEHRSARILLEWQADARVSCELAELDEREIVWWNSSPSLRSVSSESVIGRGVRRARRAADRPRRVPARGCRDRGSSPSPP